MERLLEGEADPDASMREGWRPLHYAAGGGHNGAIRRLLAAGADIHAADNAGLDALMYAAGQGTCPPFPGCSSAVHRRVERVTDGLRKTWRPRVASPTSW